MKNKFIACLSLAAFLCQFKIALSQTVPTPDHVVVVVLENHGYSTIIGSADAPYMNGLVSDSFGALFTNSHGVTHPSQPNYMYLFSGDNQNVILDFTPVSLLLPFSSANLGASLLQNGRTFVGYSEDLPSVGYTGDVSGDYHRKHNPWVNWQDGNTNGIPAVLNQPFTSFPTNYNNLPTLSFVIPNQQHDMHDGTVAQADAWMQANLDGYVQWARSHNSLLILTFDEDENLVGSNQIPTIFNGQMVKHGQYNESIDHNNVLRTMEDMYGLPYAGQSAGATAITDCWVFKPISSFTGAPLSFCPGQTVQFVDSTLNTPVTTQWLFEGATPGISTASNPTVVYDSAGAYSVTIISTNQMGSDTLVVPNYITVYPNPTISLSADSLFACFGDTITVTTSGANFYNWLSSPDIIVSGGSVMKATPPASGTYKVVGLANGCASDTVSVYVTVDSLLPVTLAIEPWADTTVCTGTVLSFTANGLNPGPAPVYDWKVNGQHTGGNSSAFSTYAFGNNYTVSCMLTSSFNCAVPKIINAGQITVSVSPLPTATITATDTLLISNPASQYQWLFNGQPIPGATAQTHIAEANGDYKVRAFNANGCSQISNTITINNIETGISALQNTLFQIVPNPNNGQFVIKWDVANVDLYTVEISDMAGRKINSKQVNLNQPDHSINFNLPELEKGLYLVNIYSKKNKATTKVIIE